MALLQRPHPVTVPQGDPGSLCVEGEQRESVAHPAVSGGLGLVSDLVCKG